jgi:hypothetical protein
MRLDNRGKNILLTVCGKILHYRNYANRCFGNLRLIIKNQIQFLSILLTFKQIIILLWKK